MTASLFDYILAPALIFISWQVLRMKDLFVGIVFYILFGLLMALAWVQLNAPDIALVEAAVGSGLTGAFFLGVLGRLEKNEKGAPEIRHELLPGRSLTAAVICGAGGVMAVLLIAVIRTLPVYTTGLGETVRAALPTSGAGNPVTAVVLNLRAYDTLLEIGVLFLVAVTVGALSRTKKFRVFPQLQAERLLMAFVHMLVPFMVLIAGYLLWAGSDRPGGAFQAGAVLAGVGVLFFLGGVPVVIDMRQLGWRLVLSVGFSGFLLTGLIVMEKGGLFLQYPPQTAKHIILLVEILATISIAGIFIYLFGVCAGFLGGGIASKTTAKEDDLL